MSAKQQPDNRNIRVLQFLDAYEKQENLWNPALESYKNKAARDEAYMNIIQDLAIPTLSINDVKLKVKSIRTTYTKELRLLTKHSKDGNGYNPKLFWFNRANAFLKNVSLSRDKRISSFPTQMNASNDCYKSSSIVDYMPTRHRRKLDESIDDVSNVAEDSQMQEDLEQAESPSDEDVTSTKHISSANTNAHDECPATVSTTVLNSKFTESCSTTSAAATNILVATHSGSHSSACSNNMADDDCDLFCRSVAAQLRNITDTYSRSVAKLKIQQILFEAETGHYRNNPCITIQPVHQNISNISNL